jgi:hypothetical protein
VAADAIGDRFPEVPMTSLPTVPGPYPWLVVIGCAFVVLLATGLVLGATLRIYFESRGPRVVTCPATGAPAAVTVDARHLAVTSVAGSPVLRLEACSRWPEDRDCAQACLAEIERAPNDCLARVILTRWYAGKSCAFCRRRFGDISWLEQKPALLGPTCITVEWRDIAPEKLPNVLATHLPVCWNCHIAETFRREHPDLVVDRRRREARYAG